MMVAGKGAAMRRTDTPGRGVFGKIKMKGEVS